MNIGICLGAYPCPVEEQIAYMKKYGFSGTFCGARNPRLGEIVDLCREAEITVENLHAPFKHINDIWLDTPDGERMLAELLESVDDCARYGIPLLVVHLSSSDYPPPINPLGMHRFGLLMAYAKEKGVTIAYENQRKLSNIALAFEEFEDAVFCYDTGHESVLCLLNIAFMPLFGKRLGALHVHDNHCVHNADEHLIPGDGTVDFARVTDDIAASDFKGTMMLEIMVGNSTCYEGVSADAYYAKAAAAARKLADTVEEKRRATK